ncbi:MAG: site-specific DNA-methyltransferase [Monoglobales bacterium]
MANLSQQKRQRMLEFLQTIREEHKDDDDVLIALGEIENELNAKKYGLVWEKHEENIDMQMQDNIPVFKECKEKEITTVLGEKYNFLLEGDNLHSLRLLEKTHAGKIDVIYIDPPYNTGNKDFRYDDRFVDGSDGFRHSKWLSFMASRVQIAYRLLSETGSILISINDIEYAQLKLLCDDMIGEHNYIGTFIWKSRQNKDNRNITGISIDHEYILAYAKKQNIRNFRGGERLVNRYSNPDNDPRGPWTSGNMVGIATEEQRPNLHYDFVDHRTGINYGKPAMGWRYDRNTMKRLVDENRIIFPDTPNGRPRRKVFLSDVKEVRPGFSSMVGTDIYTRNGTADIVSVFNKRVFDFPKPVELLMQLFEQTTNEKSIVLDFFAGSGTSAQAVLELNKKDGGHRTFILCTNNENDICESVTYPRVKTVITGQRIDGSEYSDGIFANLKYYRTDFVSKDIESTVYKGLHRVTV